MNPDLRAKELHELIESERTKRDITINNHGEINSARNK